MANLKMHSMDLVVLASSRYLLYDKPSTSSVA